MEGLSERYAALVEPHIQRALVGRRGGGPLADLLSAYPARSGKLLRPTICLATAEAFGVKAERVAPMAASLELLHNAFLIHDDFEDDSQFRRGEVTLHRLVGAPLAVHIGDVMLARAFSTAFFGAVGSLGGLDAMAALQRAIAQTEEGQALDLLGRQREMHHVQQQDYYATVLKKTCAYTTVLPMRIAASYARLHSPLANGPMVRFAMYCGVAFQIQDDLRSFGSSEANGKSSAEDLVEGKVTLPLIRFFEVGSEDGRQRANAFFRLPRPERRTQDAQWLASEIVHSGSLQYAREVAYVAAALATYEWQDLADEVVPGPAGDYLAELPIAMLTHR